MITGRTRLGNQVLRPHPRRASRGALAEMVHRRMTHEQRLNPLLSVFATTSSACVLALHVSTEHPPRVKLAVHRYAQAALARARIVLLACMHGCLVSIASCEEEGPHTDVASTWPDTLCNFMPSLEVVVRQKHRAADRACSRLASRLERAAPNTKFQRYPL